MKTFKDYLREETSIPVLSWASGFGEIRNLLPHIEADPVLAEGREGIPHISEWTGPRHGDQDSWSALTKWNKMYNPKIHDHPDYKIGKLAHDEKMTLQQYASGGNRPSQYDISDEHPHATSKAINTYLRRRMGHHRVVANASPIDVEEAVGNFSRLYKPSNTNKKPIQVYSGVSSSVGEKFASTPVGTRHVLAGFVSTSTDKHVAHDFSTTDAAKSGQKVFHIAHFHAEPTTWLSVVHHSPYSENEGVLHHGSHAIYQGSVRHTGENGHDHWVHHLKVLGDRTPLHQYPEYKD